MEFAQRLLATRRGSTIIGIAAAVLAGILLLVYISQYRNSVKSSNATVQVIVARSLIQKGTPGDVIGTQRTFQSTSIAKDQVREGAFVDAASLRGKVATTDIFPGQQLTSAEFAPASESIITTRLTGQQRAISVPVDGAHGLVGGVQTVDRHPQPAGPQLMIQVVRPLRPVRQVPVRVRHDADAAHVRGSGGAHLHALPPHIV